MNSGAGMSDGGFPGETGAEVSATEVRSELDRILSSPVFAGARRPSEFLRFVVETSLNGGGARIKEYLIGVDVFGRSAQYDPRVDPIVRIEAGRLRSRLGQYYAGPGKDDSVVIDLPKGSYVPEFRRQATVSVSAEAPAVSSPAPTASDGVGPSPLKPVQRGKMRLILVGSGFLVLMAIASVLLYHSFGGVHLPNRPPLSAKDTIVIGEFANATGDAAFDGTLKTGVSISLAQSPFLNILSDSVVASTLKLMTRPLDTSLTPAVAREVCLRSGSKAYVTGSIALENHFYVIAVSAIDCQGGQKLAEQRATVAAQPQVLDALSGAASELRRRLGESPPTLQRFDVPLSEATTSSLEALNAYSLGLRAHWSGVTGASLPYALRAIELDPNFALAYNAAANDFATLGQTAKAKDFFTKAFLLRQHASERERLKIIADYYREVTGELDQAATVFQQEIATYPRDSAANGNLGIVYAHLGEYQKSLDVTRQAVALAPQNYPNLGELLLALGRLDETKQILAEMRSKGQEGLVGHILEYGVAFQTQDLESMAMQLQWFTGQPAYAPYGIELEAETAAYFGHLKRARELTLQAVKAAVVNEDKESGAVWEAIAAQREAASGHRGQARPMADEAIKLAGESPSVQSEAALALALTGERARALSLASELDNRFPLETQMQALWLPPIKAQVALEGGDAAGALASLGSESTIELGNISFLLNFSCLYPSYVRGEAYLKAGQGAAAAAAFQTILDHTGIVWNCWTGPLAQLGVARAQAMQSKNLREPEARVARDRAVAAYDRYLKLWKDADPDVPVFRQAKAEFARLRGANPD